MTKTIRKEINIPVNRVFLHHENPRHEPYDTQAEVIDYLCANEQVPRLARDIAQHGLSPLDRFGVTRDSGKDGKDAAYTAAEGNRRLCALKLLTDPELAPAKLKSSFEKMAKGWSPITSIPCVVFEDQDDLDLWLKRRHHGTAGGIGQKPWSADQKARHSRTGSRDRLALQFLNFAEDEGLISGTDRKGRITTVQRYLSNPVMRETLGLDASDPDNLLRNRTEEDFRLLSKKFVDDLMEKRVNSRQNKEQIEEYARDLNSTPGQSHKRVEPESIESTGKSQKEKNKPEKSKPKPPTKLPWRDDIHDALQGLDNWKLQRLYHSICNVSLKDHTPLVAVGLWVFLETLTAAAGRKIQTDFHSFLSPERLTKRYGLGTKNPEVKPLRDAVERVRDFGNTTKHHDTAAAFNGEQLANDMNTLGDLILKIVEDAATSKS